MLSETEASKFWNLILSFSYDMGNLLSALPKFHNLLNLLFIPIHMTRVQILKKNTLTSSDLCMYEKSFVKYSFNILRKKALYSALYNQSGKMSKLFIVNFASFERQSNNKILSCKEWLLVTKFDKIPSYSMILRKQFNNFTLEN